MFPLLVFCGLSALIGVRSNTVTSPQIRILDVATKASETRLIPNRVDYRNSYHSHFRSPAYPHRSRLEENERPLKSYVIYDEYPLKVFREWKANPPADFSSPPPQYQPNVDVAPDYYYQHGQLPSPKPTLAYRSVYSNVIKVFDNSLDDINRSRFPDNRYFKPQIDYDYAFPQEIPPWKAFQNQKLPANFPNVFTPNENFHFSIDREPPQPPKFFYPQEGFFDTDTINSNEGNGQRHPDEVEILPDVHSNSQKQPFLCGFIRVNQRQFPKNGPCGKSDDDTPITLPEYPDYSSFPNDKIPVEHRRQHFQMKRIKRSEWNETYESRQKRDAGFGYSGWGSPFGYESSGYDGYYSNNYPSYSSRGYSRNRERNQSYRNRYSSRYDDYDDDYQNSDDSNSRGLTGYLTNGGRRYKNRKNNEDDEDDEDDNDNNRDEDSEEEMERMNNNRRDNDRRNNDDSRDRRRNNNNNSNNNSNNNNDDDDYRDNRRNRNNRRYNSNRRNNDRYDNNGRNRNYGNSNGYGYNNNGYGSSYGGYGNNYGGYGSGGYGSGSYGSSYGSNGGYGYGGGYGNFGSF